jgi:hypothetical protein
MIPGMSMKLSWKNTGAARDIIAKVHSEVMRGLSVSGIRGRYHAVGIEVIGNSPEHRVVSRNK